MYQTWDREKMAKSHTLIRRGSMRHILNEMQRKIYDYISVPGVTEVAVYSGRKAGKSFTLTVIGVEECLRNPGSIVKHCFPTLVLAAEVIEPIMTEMMNILPEDLHPRQLKSKHKWVFANGSEYQLVGAHPDNIKSGSGRGPRCNYWLFDEVAFWHAQSYEITMKSSFLPQQTLVDNPKRLYATTPPEQVDHPFITETVPPIQRKGGFFHFTVYDNPMLTPERIEQLKEECGGADSNAWRREYMAEIVVDDSRRVTPEFSRATHVVSDAYLQEIHNNPDPVPVFGFAAADLGVTDYTGMLGAVYIPSENQVLVVSEDMYKGEGLQYFADRWRLMKGAIMPHIASEGLYVPIKLTVDCFEQAGMSLRKDFKIQYVRPHKRKLVDNVGFLRLQLTHGRVLVHESCTSLIAQLETGLWKESNGKEDSKDFDRTEVHGHLDLVAALVYLVRSVPWGRSPADSSNTSLTFRGGLVK